MANKTNSTKTIDPVRSERALRAQVAYEQRVGGRRRHAVLTFNARLKKGSYKMDHEKAALVREMLHGGADPKVVAKNFDVSRQTIWLIRTGRIWMPRAR